MGDVGGPTQKEMRAQIRRPAEAPGQSPPDPPVGTCDSDRAMSALTSIRDGFEVPEIRWRDSDVLLYALSVGAAQEDPSTELAFTVEGPDRPPLVLPAFGATLAHRATEMAYRELDLRRVVHAEQALVVHRPMPAAGRARIAATIAGVYDKGSGALVVVDATTYDLDDGEPLFSTRSSVFVRGLGGFGGQRGPSSSWSAPEREPDHRLMAPTRPDQALLYRLNGDRNPLHADPEFARAAGFTRPILHGLCTYGIAGRVLMHATCGSEPARVRELSTRCSSPVVPGETLRVDAWEVSDEEVAFQTFGPDGRVVLDHGRLVRGTG